MNYVSVISKEKIFIKCFTYNTDCERGTKANKLAKKKKTPKDQN